MQEEWRDVIGYEGYYQVSSIGRIKSLKRKVCNNTGLREIKEQIMVNIADKYGYMCITLSKNRNIKTIKIHRLVAMAFIENPNNLPQVNHIDENKSNNNVSNLEWCTQKYNINYGSRTEKCSKKVVQILDNKIIKVFNSVNEASRFMNCNKYNISMCCKKKRKTTCGYKWEYLEVENVK